VIAGAPFPLLHQTPHTQTQTHQLGLERDAAFRARRERAAAFRELGRRPFVRVGEGRLAALLDVFAVLVLFLVLFVSAVSFDGRRAFVFQTGADPGAATTSFPKPSNPFNYAHTYAHKRTRQVDEHRREARAGVVVH
jgi:hypothetical protein